jgi:hypothetical protein
MVLAAHGWLLMGRNSPLWLVPGVTDSAEVHGIARPQEGDAVDEGWGKAPQIST